MAYSAVLFDMDGTLVDSIPAWHKTFNEALKLNNRASVSYEYFCRDILGQSTEADVERFFPDLSPGDLVALYDRLFPANIDSVRIFPETMEVLAYLDVKEKKKGLVTNTPRELMHMTMEAVGIAGRFDVVLGGDDVSVGKPDPEMIVKACDTLGLKPEEVVMVGDTKADMGSGKDAGCVTVGIGVEGEHRISSLGALTALLDRI